MDETTIVNAEDAAAPPATGAPKRSHHAKLQRFGNRNARKHGLGTMKMALKELGARSIDKRTRTGKAWRRGARS